MTRINSDGIQKPIQSTSTGADQVQGKRRGQKATATTPASATPAKERVNLSSAAQSLIRASGAPVNQQRVQELGQALQSGNYHIDSQKLARRISATALADLSASSNVKKQP